MNQDRTAEQHNNTNRPSAVESAVEKARAAAASVIDKVTGKHHDSTQQHTKDNTHTTTTTRDGAALHNYDEEQRNKAHKHHDNPLTHNTNTEVTDHGRTAAPAHIQGEGHTYNPASTTTAAGTTLPDTKNHHLHDNKPAAPGACGGHQDQHVPGTNNTHTNTHNMTSTDPAATRTTHDTAHGTQGFTHNKDNPTTALAGAPEHQAGNVTNPHAGVLPGTNQTVGAPVANPEFKSSLTNNDHRNDHSRDALTNPHAGVLGTNQVVGAPVTNPEFKPSPINNDHRNDHHNNNHIGHHIDRRNDHRNDYNRGALTNPHAGVLPGTNQVVGAPNVNPMVKSHHDNTHSNITRDTNVANAPSGNITGTHQQHPINTASAPAPNEHPSTHPHGAAAATHGQQPAQPITGGYPSAHTQGRPITEGVYGPRPDHPTATKLGHHHDETKISGKIQNAGHDVVEKVFGFDRNKQDNRPTI